MKQSIVYFTGIDERLGKLAGNPSGALTALNVSTDYGRLASYPGTKEMTECCPCAEPTRLYVFSDRVEAQTHEYIVVGAQDGVYAYKQGEWICIYAGASGGDWGFVTYMKNEETLMLFGNGIDPVQVWNGEDASSSPLEGAPGRGRFFALHYERVWMSGDFEHPDRVYYSRAMDINNWTPDVEIPDKGGGFVELPTFDGGEMTGLYVVSTDLCVLKSTTALLIYGSSPDSYQVVQMTGSLGTIAGRSAAVAGQNGYFITSGGIGVQAGTTISLLDDRKLPKLFDPTYCLDCDPCKEGLSPNFGKSAAGMASGERLYFSLPVGEEEQNSILLEYDLSRQTYMIHTGKAIVSMARAGKMREKLLVLTDKGEVLWWAATPQRADATALWVTPWLDFGSNGLKTVKGFSLYGRIFSEQRTAHAKVVIESDKGRKIRILTPRRGGEELYRFVFRLTGRRFRVRIESIGDAGFCFTGGLELEVD